jgi:threonine dehydratase
MACREPQDEPFNIVAKGAARIVSVSEDEIAEAVRLLFTATHNTAEGAGAAALAALMQERGRLKGKRAGVILSGGNIDTPVFATILAGGTPTV